ncbi:MAG: ParB/RepB/Spo0J family partition protein [Gemmatimonadetes bacterium]|nr:MAG: ParB/RepB/Spo0J family partition protein [Gemmatimonadota bacterium]
MGRGLGALIPGGESVGKGEHVLHLELNQIQPNALQPRREFDTEKLEELAQSIRINGVLQPIIVRQQDTDSTYELVAGERRWRASQLAGLTKIPAIVRDVSNDQLLQLALIENIQRENLNPVEEAQAYEQLIQQWGWTQEELAVQVGKSRSTITNVLRLLKLPLAIQKYLQEGHLSMGHARALLALPDTPSQIYYGELAIKEKLSVREIEALVKKNQRSGKKSGNRNLKIKSPQLSSVEAQLRTLLGTKVVVNQKSNKKGKIEIEFYSNEDLNRLIEQFSKIGGSHV